jgi:hydroxypyruvate isomerase
MLKASVCIDAVFEKQSLDEVIPQVAACGYSAIEFWCWWEKDLPQVLALCAEHQLKIAACCTRFVSLVDPTVREAYLQGLKESIKAAQQLGCKTLISQVGNARPGVSRQEQHDCLVEGLREAAELLRDTDITLAIEPLNELVDHPGYYLIRSQEAFEIIDEVQSPNVGVTFDIYHQQISEGHLIDRILSHIDKIAHFHAAGNPGRHELTLGEIEYRQIFAAIAQTDFAGYVGLEYWPKQPPQVGLREVAGWSVWDARAP